MSASHLRLIRDDDSYIDRLSHRYTVAICVLFCVIVSTKQYAGDPIGQMTISINFSFSNYLIFILKC